MQRLRRESTVDRLTEALAGEILAGRLMPGDHLREADFAARFEVSRNTLREACHRLADDGLVVHRPHRGVTVARPTEEAVAEIFRIRRLLEPIGDLRRLAAEMTRAAEEMDWARLVDIDLGYHARLVAGLASPRLDDFFASILRELRLSFVLIDSGDGDPPSPSHVPDHGRIAAHMERGETDAARSLLLDHLCRAERLVLNHLSESRRTVEAAVGGR
jgi:DNA-binding GntR family transcriptional regulator